MLPRSLCSAALCQSEYLCAGEVLPECIPFPRRLQPRSPAGMHGQQASTPAQLGQVEMCGFCVHVRQPRSCDGCVVWLSPQHTVGMIIAWGPMHAC
jgi:hypothetical protein